MSDLTTPNPIVTWLVAWLKNCFFFWAKIAWALLLFVILLKFFEYIIPPDIWPLITFAVFSISFIGCSFVLAIYALDFLFPPEN